MITDTVQNNEIDLQTKCRLKSNLCTGRLKKNEQILNTYCNIT